MAINFPASPTTNQSYTYNGRTWTYNGIGWQATGSTGLTVYTKTNFTSTAGQTSYSATYTVGFVDVYYNGSKLSTSEYTATSGTTVVLGTAAAAGDIVETIAWTISSSFNPSLGSASATSMAIGGATIGSNALAVTGASQFNGGVTATGRITQSLSPVSAEYALKSSGQTTGWIAVQMDNTGGSYIVAGENSTGNNLIIGDSAYDMVIRGPSGISFSANAGTTQHMRLTSAGNLGIGMTPARKLDVTGTFGATGAATFGSTISCSSGISGYSGTFTTTNPDAPVNCGVNSGGATTQISLYSGGTTGAVAFNGSAYVLNTTSDERLKNWSGIEQPDYRAGIQKLWIGSFDLYQNKEKTGDSIRGFGVLAQQAYDALGGLAITKPTNEDDIWQASSEPFAFLALWGVKDLYKIIDNLTARLAALEAK